MMSCTNVWWQVSNMPPWWRWVLFAANLTRHYLSSHDSAFPQKTLLSARRLLPVSPLNLFFFFFSRRYYICGLFLSLRTHNFMIYYSLSPCFLYVFRTQPSGAWPFWLLWWLTPSAALSLLTLFVFFFVSWGWESITTHPITPCVCVYFLLLPFSCWERIDRGGPYCPA